MRLLLFEFRKMIRTKTIPFLFLVTLLFVCALYARNLTQQDMVAANKIEWFSGYIQEVAQQNSTDRRMMMESPSAELEKRLDIGIMLQSQLNELIDSIEKGAWEDELQQEIDVYKTAIAYKDARGSYSLSEADMEDMIRTNGELLRLGLPKEDIDRSIQPPLFMKQMVSFVLNPIGYLVVLLLFGMAITREFEERNIQMIYTFPIPKWRYVLIKFTAMLLTALVWLSFFMFISYLLPTLVTETRENNFDYPLLLVTGEFLQVGTYIKEGMIYGIGVLFFSIAIVVLIGFGLRQTIISVIATIAIFIGGWMGVRNGMDVFLNPFTYVSENETILTQPTYYPGGFIVLLGISILLLLAAMWGNQKRGVS